MAGLTSSGCGFVKEHLVAAHLFSKTVAGRAGYILMSALQRERGLLMVKKGRPPFVVAVACGAVVRLGAELVCMRILVALIAYRGGVGKVNMEHGQFHVWRLVAINAGHGAMRSDQRKVGLSVVKLRQVSPFPR